MVCGPLFSAGALPHPAVPAAAVTWPGVVPPSAMPAAPRKTTALAAARAITILCRDMAGSLVLVEHRCPFGGQTGWTWKRWFSAPLWVHWETRAPSAAD